MEYKDLSPEQQEKASACKTAEELITLAKEEGMELSEEQIDSISGGAWSSVPPDGSGINDRRSRV